MGSPTVRRADARRRALLDLRWAKVPGVVRWGARVYRQIAEEVKVDRTPPTLHK